MSSPPAHVFVLALGLLRLKCPIVRALSSWRWIAMIGMWHLLAFLADELPGGGVAMSSA